MGLIYKVGDITLADDPCIAHGCNMQGVMGSGVALAIKNAIPKAFEAYQIASFHGTLALGTIEWGVRLLRDPRNPRMQYVANCITQRNYGKTGERYVDYDAIANCMTAINATSIENHWKTVALPMIGAGLGGGNWEIISKIIEVELKNVQPIIYVLDEKQIPIRDGSGFTKVQLSELSRGSSVVEHCIENAGVDGSNPSPGTITVQVSETSSITRFYEKDDLIWRVEPIKRERQAMADVAREMALAADKAAQTPVTVRG